MKGQGDRVPVVTVAIPAYNSELYIEKAIQSVLNQTERRIEVVVVDDASQDGTVDRIKGFSDPRVRLIEHEVNQGAGIGMNDAFQSARGEWVAILDGDDWYSDDRLERLLRYVEKHDVDMIADDLQYFDQTKEPVEDGSHLHHAGSLFSPTMKAALPRLLSTTEFVLGNRPGPRNPSLGLLKPMFRRSFVERHELQYYEDEVYNDDTCFFLKCLVMGARMLLVPEIGYHYRRHAASVTKATPWIEILGEQAKRNRLLLDEYRDSGNELVLALKARGEAIDRAAGFERTRLNLAENGVGGVFGNGNDMPSFISFGADVLAVRTRNRLRGIARKFNRHQ